MGFKVDKLWGAILEIGSEILEKWGDIFELIVSGGFVLMINKSFSFI